jgi:hypothetical protein
MKYIIKESQYKLLVEQSNDSSVDCNKNISKSAGSLNFWNNMDTNKRNELVKTIKPTIGQSLQKSKEEYLKWFQNPLTIKKFRTPKEKEIVKKLPSYIQSINKINLHLKGTNSSPNARAWVNSKEPNAINYNLSQLHDGTDFQGQSIEFTTKHEMGHLIDYFFKRNGIDAYLQTISTETQDEYNNNYLVNDMDQYSRLNVLRGIVGAGPNDHPTTLLNKFLVQVKSGKITSDKFNFSSISSTSPGITQKNDIANAKEVNKVLTNAILVDGKPNLNIEQLFSNFGLVKNGNVYVSFDLLAQLNLTSKDLEKKYYFLKMVPK